MRWPRHRRDEDGLWSQEPSLDGYVEPIGDLPGTVLREAAFVPIDPPDELWAWRSFFAFLCGCNAAVLVLQIATVVMFWRTSCP